VILPRKAKGPLDTQTDEKKGSDCIDHKPTEMSRLSTNNHLALHKPLTRNVHLKPSLTHKDVIEAKSTVEILLVT